MNGKISLRYQQNRITITTMIKIIIFLKINENNRSDDNNNNNNNTINITV